jgi:hypothetical protein
MTITEIINNHLKDLIEGFDPSQSLEEVLAVWDKAMWGLWLDLVQADYTSEILIAYAKEHAWVEESNGQWPDQPRFAAQAMVAFYSLRNCFYLALINTDCDLAQYVRREFGNESKTQRKKRLKRTARLERELQDLKDRRDECQAMIATLEAASPLLTEKEA